MNNFKRLPLCIRSLSHGKISQTRFESASFSALVLRPSFQPSVKVPSSKKSFWSFWRMCTDTIFWNQFWLSCTDANFWMNTRIICTHIKFRNNFWKFCADPILWNNFGQVCTDTTIWHNFWKFCTVISFVKHFWKMYMDTNSWQCFWQIFSDDNFVIKLHWYPVQTNLHCHNSWWFKKERKKEFLEQLHPDQFLKACSTNFHQCGL